MVTKFIEIEKLHEHPDNPRKNLGDLTELADSIKQNGVMQNITVIPHETLENEYTLLIGHRRCAAAKLAGLKTVPCAIVKNLSKREQVSIMLEENMQRNDLTIVEQAQGFQMMLDLGETAETISEKTGFSKATVYHRLNLAKLDGKKLKEKEESFQLSLNDLYALEQVESIDERNKILEQSSSSEQIRMKANSAAKEQKERKIMQTAIDICKEAGIEEVPKKEKDNIYYSNKWEEVKYWTVDDIEKGKFKLPKKLPEGTMWMIRYRSLYLYAKKKKEKKELTPEEIKRKQIEKNRKQAKEIMNNLSERFKDFLKLIVSGEIKLDDKDPDLLKSVFNMVMNVRRGIYLTEAITLMTGEETYYLNKLNEDDCKKIEQSMELPVIVRLICGLYIIFKDAAVVDYYGKMDGNLVKDMEQVISFAKEHGFELLPEEEELINGSSELYIKD